MTSAIHRLGAEAALASLRSTVDGLTSPEALARQREFGFNRLVRARERPLIVHFVAQLTHFFALMLWAAAALAMLAARENPGSGMETLAEAIVAVILVNGVFSYWQERRAHKAMAALQRLLPESVRVRRDGHLVETSSATLVPGDVIELAEGDHIPADCRLIEAFDVKVDLATLTGESLPQTRSVDPDVESPDEAPAIQRNMALAGTSMAAGRALGLVVATGMRTEFGRIAHLTQTAPDTVAPLQRELVHLSRMLGALSLLLGLALLLVGRFIGLPFWDNAVFAIGVIVANVPEGLLPTLTLSLAMAAERMAARKMLVRHLPAVQTLGSATVICTDKTGTLTENRMVARRLFVANEFADVAALSSHEPLARRHWRLFEGAAHCETVRAEDDGTGPRWRGDPMEVALVQMARSALPDMRTLPRVDLLPFSAERKRLATLHEEGDLWVLYVKGAVEAILPRCNGCDGPEGEGPLDESVRQTIVDAEASLASAGLRVLAFAYRRLSERPEREHLEESLVFAGLVGLHDPPRQEVPQAVARCHQAGIKVVMVTGDHPQTAHAVARLIGLVRGARPTVVSGQELDRVSDAQLRFVLKEPELIFARVSADQKLRIVRAFQQSGAIVAVTGDGVNDAPALKAADIGVAMGVTGTDVAREAADVVLLDDNFASIVAAIEEGRGVFGNIRKFIAYVLTSNVPELVPYLAFVLLRIPLPLTIIQVLAVDLGTDILPALGLGAERPEPDVMSRPPRSRDERVVDKGLLVRAYIWLGTIEAAAGMAAYAAVLRAGGWSWGTPLAASSLLYRQATTACLTAIVITQVANVYACRSEVLPVRLGGVFENPLIVGGIVVELVLIAVIDYTSWGQALFGTMGIPLTAWLVAVPFAAGLIGVDRLMKRRR